jgi:putative oxidoreductase
MNKLTSWLDDNRDGALFVVRVLLGLMFVFVHGWPKIAGGTAAWLKLGTMVGVLGITFNPVALGFIAAVCEFAGGIMLTLGLFTRLGAAMILSTLLVAAPTMYISTSLFAAAPSIEDSLFMLLLIFLGAGRYSLDHVLFGGRKAARGLCACPAALPASER